jgi:hypothetical protein
MNAARWAERDDGETADTDAPSEEDPVAAQLHSEVIGLNASSNGLDSGGDTLTGSRLHSHPKVTGIKLISSEDKRKRNALAAQAEDKKESTGRIPAAFVLPQTSLAHRSTRTSGRGPKRL